MLFAEEDAPLLKAWIVKRIENTSDADSDVLAEYVIALLKHDGDPTAVRKLCEQEIPDFLTEEPKAFLDDVFQAIEYKTYLPGAPPPPPPSQRAAGPEATKSAAPDGSRKRAFDGQADAADASERDQAYGGHRSHKQPRRGARRAMDNTRDGRHGDFSAMDLPPPPHLTHFDLNNPMETFMHMQAMGIPFPPLPHYPQQAFAGRSQRNQPRRKGRCRDFDTKGYCSRGSTCLYDHGNDPIYAAPAAPGGEEYDPNDAAMQMSTTAPNQPFAFSLIPDSNRGRGARRARGNGNRGARRGGARAPFSAEGPVHDRTKSTIVVENIPEESFNEDQVRSFFSQFGNIVDISMQPYKHLALVKYDKWAAANDAYRSPKVIFDNRFVKVFWYKDEQDPLPSSLPPNGAKGSKLARTISLDSREPEPEVDMEEFNRKQDEAQKQHRERLSRRREVERQRQALEKQHQDLLAKHQAETERLQARMANKNGGDAGAGSSGTDMLRAQLAALEQEAKILGLDPNVAEDDGMSGNRGGFRGRRGYRARGGSAPRGRGSFRGHGARHAAYAQYSIDNRPKRVTVAGADFASADKGELLRHFLLNLGGFESVETTPSLTHVSFQDRKTAEKFYYSLHGKELPGVEGKLDLSWVTTPAGPAPPARQPAASAAASSDDGIDDDGRDEPEPEPAGRPPLGGRQMDMDYEVGDDDDWGDGIQ